MIPAWVLVPVAFIAAAVGLVAHVLCLAARDNSDPPPPAEE